MDMKNLLSADGVTFAEVWNILLTVVSLGGMFVILGQMLLTAFPNVREMLAPLLGAA